MQPARLNDAAPIARAFWRLHHGADGEGRALLAMTIRPRGGSGGDDDEDEDENDEAFVDDGIFGAKRSKAAAKAAAKAKKLREKQQRRDEKRKRAEKRRLLQQARDNTYCFYTPAQWVMPCSHWAADEKPAGQ